MQVNATSCQSKFEVYQVMTEKLFSALKAIETLASGTIKVNQDYPAELLRSLFSSISAWIHQYLKHFRNMTFPNTHTVQVCVEQRYDAV